MGICHDDPYGRLTKEALAQTEGYVTADNRCVPQRRSSTQLMHRRPLVAVGVPNGFAICCRRLRNCCGERLGRSFTSAAAIEHLQHGPSCGMNLAPCWPADARPFIRGEAAIRPEGC